MPPTPKLRPEDLEKGLRVGGKCGPKIKRFGEKEMRFGENPRSGYQ